MTEDPRLSRPSTSGTRTRRGPTAARCAGLNVKVTGLAQNLGQLEAVNREFQSKCYQQFDKRPCPIGQWIAAQKCQNEPCPLTCECMDGFVKRKEDQQCYQSNTRGYCDSGKIVKIAKSKIRCLQSPCNEGEIPWRDVTEFNETWYGYFDEGPKLNQIKV